MANQDDKLELSKKGKREISPFIGHELLYDFLSGSLDSERRAAIEEHVKFSRDAQLDLAKIQQGQNYSEKLSATVVSQPILDTISAPASYLTVLIQKSNFDKWPQGLKWGLEALVVVFAIVLLLTLTPWQNLIQYTQNIGSDEVILAEASKTSTSMKTEEAPEFVDEGVKEPGTPVKGSAPVKVVEVPTPPVKEVAKVPTPVATSKPVAAVAPAVIVDEGTSPQTSGGGFLYRGEIAITNIESNGPKISDKIRELGGRKAGGVELGWKKTPTSMYYHFTIPEAKYQDLLTYFAIYGTPKISKEKHSRVMPDGIIRLIITVDEN